MRLKGKVAIVAGAAWGGIGAATALRFAEEGAKLVINTRRRQEMLSETAGRIRDVGGEVVTVMGDVKDLSAWEAMREAALEAFGRIDILVHNASHTYVKPPIDFTLEEWNEGLAVTLGGPWLGAKHCIPEMANVGGGSIVFVSTVNATITNPGFGLYSSAKGGLNALTRSIALEYGRGGHSLQCHRTGPDRGRAGARAAGRRSAGRPDVTRLLSAGSLRLSGRDRRRCPLSRIRRIVLRHRYCVDRRRRSDPAITRSTGASPFPQALAR